MQEFTDVLKVPQEFLDTLESIKVMQELTDVLKVLQERVTVFTSVLQESMDMSE